MDSDNDSDSSSDDDDFDFEEIEDDQSGNHCFVQSQVTMPTRLFIKPKNPDHMDETPKIELVTSRKAMQQTLFVTKVKVSTEQPKSKSEEAKEVEHPQFVQVEKPQQKSTGTMKNNSQQNQMLCETAPADQNNDANPNLSTKAKDLGFDTHFEQEDDVLQLYWSPGILILNIKIWQLLIWKT